MTLSRVMSFPNGTHLYVSGVEAYQGNTLSVHRIGVVLSVLHEPRLPSLQPYGIAQHVFGVYDSPTEIISTIFPCTYRIIWNALRAGKNVLIHCHAGISRSVTVLTAFLLQVLRQNACMILPYLSPQPFASWTEALLDLIRRARPIANPNPGFLAQLRAFEDNLFRTRA